MAASKGAPEPLVRYLLRQLSRGDLSRLTLASYNQTHTVGHLTRISVTLDFVVTDKDYVSAATMIAADAATPPAPVEAPAAVAAVPPAPRAYDLADQPVLQEEPAHEPIAATD